MKFTGNNSIKNYVFDGAYDIFHSPRDTNLSSFFDSVGVNPTGVTGIFVYYSDGGNSTDSGYLSSGYSFSFSYISGADSSPSSQSGYLYYNISTPIFGACHGFGKDESVWREGYNFYNAFHPEGYISPPYGQNISIFKSNTDGVAALSENGNCPDLTSIEYNDIIGISSKVDHSVDASADGLIPDSDSFINSPAIACPQDLSVNYYWHELQYKIIGGTAASIGGNTFFNTNPIPTALDMVDIKVGNRYKATPSGLGNRQTLMTIDFSKDGKPVPNYLVSYQANKLNNRMCSATIAENRVSNGIIERSLLLDSPDVLSNPSKGTFEVDAWWHIYHFLFKENSDGFPFTNDYKSASKGQDNVDYVGLAKTPNTANYGSKLFDYILSDHDHYWENRQCPNVVDFLPYTFGGAIYACPSYHFDVPYYAALNKFGFYGTRFLNGCISLELIYSLSGDSVKHPNAIEIPSGYSYVLPDEEEPDNDKGVAYSNSKYDNLLLIAKLEQNSSDFYALNKSLFFWANSGLIFNDSSYQYLIDKYQNFHTLLVNCFGELPVVFPNGRSDLLTKSSWVISGDAFDIYYSGSPIYSLSNNENYKYFSNEIPKIMSDDDGSIWKSLESKYGYAFLTSLNKPDTGFYKALENKRNKRFQDRYLENYIHGNPIDLYPTNKILFGFDQAKNYIESPDWGKKLATFGKNSDFTDTGLNRRYFLGAYLDGEDLTGISNFAGIIANTVKNSSFYPGYFNSPSKTIDIPKRNYIPVITGNIYSGDQSLTNQSIINGQNALPYGWLAIGYNEIGRIQNNFSCFTPIFVQQPLQTVHCKIGQSPTFRCLAVDYHTIPEDKMNNRYPEIMYWMRKLKISNNNNAEFPSNKSTNKYPLSYKWYRIKKSDCNNDFKNFIVSGDFAIKNAGDIYHDALGSSKVVPSDPAGDWCCLEGDGPICTLIHPTKCNPVFTPNNTWSHKYALNPVTAHLYQDAKKNNFYMDFKKGASIIGGSDVSANNSSASADDKYYYFCMARGRFGVRISEPSELFIDKKLQFDVSIQNGANASFSIPISLEDGNGNVIEMEPSSVEKYGGFSRDDDFVPENVIEMKIPPPNRGFGDVYSYKFVGTWKYGGTLQSYTPGTLIDTRGLRETWHRVLHYGPLIKYSKELSQSDGDMLYGKYHYPQCNKGDYQSNNQKGIKVNVKDMVHWSTMQKPIAYNRGGGEKDNSSAGYGVKWNKLGNAGELYIPTNHSNNANTVTVSPGIGQWQYGNNLGTIHSFGYKSPQSDLEQTPVQLTPQEFEKLKNNLLTSAPGGSCGWNKYALGRNMAYWIEGFSSFYIFCDPLKKKNVTNYNYMGPGLRQTNSSIQYFWLGNPENGYLSRYPMFGPYAYQWKYNRHNRDRNGNGISEGFYSYGWGTNYSLMYDTPAIYGLFRKYGQSKKDIAGIDAARREVFGNNLYDVKNKRFGFTMGDGGARRYGDIWIGNKTDTSTPNPTKDYVISGESFAWDVEINLYGCADDDLKNGDCFDPCISMRYANGLVPGGKHQNAASNAPAGNGYRIVANNPVINNEAVEETYSISGVFFRGPFGTPHHKYLKSIGKELNGFSPCFDGGADHCNYITPTINIGTSSYFEKSVLYLYDAVKMATASTNYPYPP